MNGKEFQMMVEEYIKKELKQAERFAENNKGIDDDECRQNLAYWEGRADSLKFALRVVAGTFVV